MSERERIAIFRYGVIAALVCRLILDDEAQLLNRQTFEDIFCSA